MALVARRFRVYFRVQNAQAENASDTVILGRSPHILVVATFLKCQG